LLTSGRLRTSFIFQEFYNEWEAYIQHESKTFSDAISLPNVK